MLSNDLRRFSTLVEDLLEISRIDAGAAQLDQSAVGIAGLMNAIVRQSRQPDLVVDFDPDDAELIAEVDKLRIAQVFTNLIDNAINYAGGVESVSFAAISADEVEILVTDRGPGVAEADRRRIFERFTRAAVDAGRRGSSKGAGLGLSLAYEHVRLHGGTMGVRDRDDGESGAQFFVCLPLAEPIDDEEMAS
ncbi:MAG: HAMP domain-containing sensor histidine kinase [Acidimicrobiales bacterium]